MGSEVYIGRGTTRSPEGKGKPVTCYVCGKEMYYSSHPSFVPEYKIKMRTADKGGAGGGTEYFYVHKTCWDAVMDKVTKLRELDQIVGV
jgi:hypothetical protein